MRREYNVLLQGDLFMRPEIFREKLDRAARRNGVTLRYTVLEQPYPVEKNDLPQTALPSGMGLGWDDISHSPGEEVGECTGTMDFLKEQIKGKDLLFLHMVPVTEEVLKEADRLLYIGCFRGGVPNINLKAAGEAGIPVCNCPGRNAEPVAEFTIGMMLAHSRYIARGHESIRRGYWEVGAYRGGNAGPLLAGQTAGLIGFGAIGQNIAKRLRGFDMKVIYYDPYVGQEAGEVLGALKREMEEVLREADFLILCTKLTKETRHMIGRKELSAMKPTAHLINAARGGLLNYDALYDALKEGEIAGAALDVYDPEPPLKGNSLLSLPNVTVTPHIAAASSGVVEKSAEIAAEEFEHFLKGEPLTRCVNQDDLKGGTADV